MKSRIDNRHTRRTSTLIERIWSIGGVGEETNLLTRGVGLPVGQALPDILHPEFFSGRAVLIITLESTNNNSSLRLGEEFRAVGEVLDDPERHEPCNDRRQTFQNKNPRPARFPTDSVHLCDGSLLGRHVRRSSRGGRILRTASKPPNAPETEAAEKKSAVRRPSSERLYQLNRG